MSTIITVENLGKKYTLRHQQKESYTALRDVISNSVASFGNRLLSPFRTLSSEPRLLTPENEDFWALKDVSFEVRQGDRIGIIGRNGAGKSTLLKILSRITEPTTGSIRIKGRVASLLEVGTGFHPELTGRENIYLNGAILGMSRAEIRKKFDEIVDFAEIEKFLDTPVKRYSSGMYVRLAFAVAAHLEPEILVVDEVLAVGDAQFQKKCLGKMEDVSAKEGRTVLFVSHNMPIIENLCCRVIHMQDGQIASTGDSHSVIASYLQSLPVFGVGALCSVREGIRDVEISEVRILNGVVRIGDPLIISITYQQLRGGGKRIVECGMSIWNDNEVKIVSISSLHKNEISTYPSCGTVSCIIPKLPLVHGVYCLNVFVTSSDGIEDYLVRAAQFNVHESDYFGTGKLVDPAWGCVVVDHSWNLE